MQKIDGRTPYQKCIDTLNKGTSPSMNLNPNSTCPNPAEQNNMESDFNWRPERRKYLEELKQRPNGLPEPEQFVQSLHPSHRGTIPLNPGPLIYQGRYNNQPQIPK